MSIIGQGIDRLDGWLKVTGQARYSAEYPIPGLAYGVMVLSMVPKGRIVAIDSESVRRMPGVLLVMTHQSAPRLPKRKDRQGKSDGGKQSKPDQKQQPPNPKLSLLQDDRVEYTAQPIAVVVADSFERARDRARRLQVAMRSNPRSSTSTRRNGICVVPNPSPTAPPTRGAATSRAACGTRRQSSSSPTRRRWKTTIRSSRTRPLPCGRAIS